MCGVCARMSSVREAAGLQAVPGIGPTKARRLYEAFDRPFFGGAG